MPLSDFASNMICRLKRSHVDFAFLVMIYGSDQMFTNELIALCD
jgi:hypothetical protein